MRNVIEENFDDIVVEMFEAFKMALNDLGEEYRVVVAANGDIHVGIDGDNQDDGMVVYAKRFDEDTLMMLYEARPYYKVWEEEYMPNLTADQMEAVDQRIGEILADGNGDAMEDYLIDFVDEKFPAIKRTYIKKMVDEFIENTDTEYFERKLADLIDDMVE